MLSWENPDDRVAVVQMNTALRHAQLELLSAECATNQLRLRFSVEDLASFAQTDILQKAINAARRINQYYSSVEKQIPGVITGGKVSADQFHEAIACLSSYLRMQRERYFPLSAPLNDVEKRPMEPFFSPSHLDQTRIVELKGARVSTPAFYPDVKALGFDNLPDVTHMASLTFGDVIIFNETLTERALFHGLVHAVQFRILGLERYAEFYVRGFVRTTAHFMVPLEAQAFALESRFAENPAEGFSVEEQVRLWLREGRY